MMFTPQSERQEQEVAEIATELLVQSPERSMNTLQVCSRRV